MISLPGNPEFRFQAAPLTRRLRADLSPWERLRVRVTHPCHSDQPALVSSRTNWKKFLPAGFPLPWGEGQGEGSRLNRKPGKLVLRNIFEAQDGRRCHPARQPTLHPSKQNQRYTCRSRPAAGISSLQAACSEESAKPVFRHPSTAAATILVCWTFVAPPDLTVVRGAGPQFFFFLFPNTFPSRPCGRPKPSSTALRTSLSSTLPSMTFWTSIWVRPPVAFSMTLLA